jgi:poly(3-hydroxybutyrate) depolymerase
MVMPRAYLYLAAAALVGILGALYGIAGESGWSTLTIEATESYSRLYVPVAASRPAPVVIFLHGSGAWPELYERYLEAAAEAAGCVMILPRSILAAGWGSEGDEKTIAESLAQVRLALELDSKRIAIAGHSSGGAYAYLLAYTTRARYAAVFTLAAPFYPVDAIADPYYTAPIRMYYGSHDPNYTGGAHADLVAQWQRLGVPYEVDFRPGYYHNTWPDESMEQGLSFLVSHSYQLPPTPYRSLAGWRRLRRVVVGSPFEKLQGVCVSGSIPRWLPVNTEGQG